MAGEPPQNSPAMRHLPLLLTLAASSAFAAAAADPCDQPRPRDIAPLMKAVQEDEAMANEFEATAAACATVSAACDAEIAKCQPLLTATLQRQVQLDDGTYLRDMLLPFLGQKYLISAGIPTGTVTNDVSCNADAASLKAAATRRKQQAQKRRDIMNEYPKWAQWAFQLSQKCKSEAALAKQQQETAAATAAASAAAAAAAAAAETKKQEEARKAQELAQEKAAADQKAKEDALRAQEDAKKKQQEQLVDQQQRAKDEQQRKAEEAEKAKKAAEEAAIAAAAAKEATRLVNEREGKKAAAEKKALEMEDAEDARHAAAVKAIADVRGYDRSDERLKGSFGAMVHGMWLQQGNHPGNTGSLLMGGVVNARYGFWGLAPPDGMAWGLELRAAARFDGEVVGNQGFNLVSVQPDFRYFFARFGAGVAFEWRRLFANPGQLTGAPNDFALGPQVAVAIVDSPTARFIVGLKWLPVLSWDLARLTGEIEIAYKWFYATLTAGSMVVPTDSTKAIGWFAGGGLGARVRF